MITVTHSGATVMPLRPLSVLAAAAVAAISVAGGCADEQPATPAPKAPTTSGLLPTSVPTEGTRPPADALPPPAEPQAAPAQTATIAGRLIPVGSAPEGVVVDAVTRTVAVAKRNPNELVLLNADTGSGP